MTYFSSSLHVGYLNIQQNKDCNKYVGYLGIQQN